MSFDEYQKAWQQQGATGQVTMGREALLKLVRSNHQGMKKMFFGHYSLMVVFGLIYVPLWIWMGVSGDLPWTWYLEIPAFLWVVGFLVANRRVRWQEEPQPGDSVRTSVEHSLAQVTQQIRLQKNVLWWYILPPAVPMAIFFVHCGLLSGEPWGMVFNLILGTLVFWGAYELIQRGVRKNLEPRRKELQEFLESLDRSEPEDSE